MQEIVSKPSGTTASGLNCATTILIVAICLRVAFGPTPAHWLHTLAPMFLLASLTLCLAQTPLANPMFRLETVALLSVIYILSTAALAQLSAWHWTDQMGLAGFCLITTLIGFEQNSRQASSST